MANYDLIGNDDVQETFSFVLSKGLKYEMAYPTMEELENLQELNIKLRELTEAKDNDAAKKVGKELDVSLHALIKPVGHETPLEEALKKENVRVMRNFSKMLQHELSIG